MRAIKDHRIAMVYHPPIARSDFFFGKIVFRFRISNHVVKRFYVLHPFYIVGRYIRHDQNFFNFLFAMRLAIHVDCRGRKRIKLSAPAAIKNNFFGNRLLSVHRFRGRLVDRLNRPPQNQIRIVNRTVSNKRYRKYFFHNCHFIILLSKNQALA